MGFSYQAFDALISVSVSWTRRLPDIPSASANFKMVEIVGWFCPSSIREIKFRCTPDSKLSCSWVSPRDSLCLRSTFPKANGMFSKRAPDILGESRSSSRLSLPYIWCIWCGDEGSLEFGSRLSGVDFVGMSNVSDVESSTPTRSRREGHSVIEGRH